ncbi:MAG TPA: hypothetical protein VHT91_21170 [Kofleriaceae bacterium]|jgi:hypothetical protein|nr:hypothetical protein [Kofleriaceae bacterium]
MATRTAAPARTFRSSGLGLACALVCGAVTGCTASGADIEPKRDQLAFPTGLKLSPDGAVLFVVNANSELRYDSGSLNVFDVNRVDQVTKKWLAYLAEPANTTDRPDCATFAQTTLPGDPKIPAPEGGQPLSCSCDPDNTDTLICDESYFINTNAGVKVGNFATDISVQDLGKVPDIGNKLRVFVPTRGDPSISWADFYGAALHCTTGSVPFPLCDDAHRLTSLYNDTDLAALPNEPFSVFADAFPSVDPAGNPVMHGFAMVGHLASGAVTLIDAPADSTKVQIADILTGVFGDPSTAFRGATSITARRTTPPPPLPGDRDGDGIKDELDKCPDVPEDKDGFEDEDGCPDPAPGEGFPELAPEALYVASNTDNRVQLFDVGMRGGAAGFLLPGPFFLLDAVGTMAGSSSDSRAIRFSADGTRLYLVNRAPPSLQVYDTSPGPDGAPRNTLLGSSDLCRDASAAAVAGARFNADGTVDNSNERVYVTCFQDGQIYAVDPFGQSQVEDIISVGRGPYAVDVYPPQYPTQIQPMPPPPRYLFVSNFLEDTLAVIDIAPGSPTRHRVVLRIGTPRTP